MSNTLLPPPPYDGTGTSTTTINYATGLSGLVIGGTVLTDSLVGIAEIKGHLALLHAFAELKKKVESSDFDVPCVPQDKAKRWAWFVGLAVERFDAWCKSISEDDHTISSYVVIPPIEVVMVWHSYMLNPRWYKEDCMRIDVCNRLKTLESHFQQLLLDPSLMLSDPPAKPRVDHWHFNTQLGFDLLKDARNVSQKIVQCPICDVSITVDYMNTEGTGYFQHNFSTSCPNETCSFGQITKEKLALRKLACDLAKPITEDPADNIAGTYYSSDALDVERGKKIKDLVCKAATSNQKLPQADSVNANSEHRRKMYLAIMELCKYSLDLLRRRMGFSYQPALVGRILSAYNDDKPYSVELVGAVLRQGSFISKMSGLGWTASGFFDGPANELVLRHALTRYHAFLDLISSSLSEQTFASPPKFYIPTLDIDLVWHTHQLKPVKYEHDCTRLMNRLIDHDDKVEGIRLSSAFDITQHAWKERFGVQYTYCGCPAPGKTIGERLLRAIGHKTQNNVADASHFLPLSRPDALAATHPSDHNSVRFVAYTGQAQKVKTQKYDDLTKKKMKERQDIVKKASKMSDTNQQAAETVCSFDPAFLFPIPLESGEGALGDDGCLASDGSIVTSIAGYGSGCSGSGCGGGLGGGGDGNPGQSSYTYQIYPKMM